MSAIAPILIVITAMFIVSHLQLSDWHYDMTLMQLVSVCQLAMTKPPRMMNKAPRLSDDREDWVDS